jgi:hypothetical protein
MATEKQIAANRRNAQRSTGPRTVAGKSISRRNAFRHGLSLPQQVDVAAQAEIDKLVHQIVGDHIDNYKLLFATETASALMDLLRVRQVRSEMLATLNLACASPAQLHRLLAIDRYESRARTRRRRAAAKMEILAEATDAKRPPDEVHRSKDGGDRSSFSQNEPNLGVAGVCFDFGTRPRRWT